MRTADNNRGCASPTRWSCGIARSLYKIDARNVGSLQDLRAWGCAQGRL